MCIVCLNTVLCRFDLERYREMLMGVQDAILAHLPKWASGRLSGLNSLHLRFAKGAFWSLAGAVILQGATLLVSIPVARLLGQASYGELGIILSTLTMFAVFTGPSLGMAATKYVAEYRATDPERASRIMGLTSLSASTVSALLAVLLFLAAPYLARNTLNAPHLVTELRIASLVLFLSGFNAAQTGALAGLQAFRAIAKANLWRGLLTFPAMVMGAWKWGLPGAVGALAVLALVGVVANQIALGQATLAAKLPVFYRTSHKEWRVLVSFSLPSLLAGVVVVPVTWWANTMLVQRPNGYVEMGVFSAANQWRSVLLFLPAVLSLPILPMLSELYGTGSVKAYGRMLVLNFVVVFTCAFLPALVVIIASQRIMWAYGSGFAEGWVVLVLLSISAVLSASSSVVGSSISSMGKMWNGFALNAIWAIVFVVSFTSLSQDAHGLAVAYVISYSIHLLTSSVYVVLLLRSRTPGVRKANDYLSSSSENSEGDL